MPSNSRMISDKGLKIMPPGMPRPQGAPRGLLMHYVLHMLDRKPAHGYEILQAIESKTDGAWRPGAGSIYPILKKLQSNGYIEVAADAEADRGETGQRKYQITPKGKACLNEANATFAHAGQMWNALRRVFIDFIDDAHLAKFFAEGTRTQFELTQELLNAKIGQIPVDEAKFMLKDYVLVLERHLHWTKGAIVALEAEGIGRQGADVAQAEHKKGDN